jgi:putative phosphoesterase
MKIAALYDIHGNLPALEAVIADIHRESVDRIVLGGDVLLGPMPRETFDLLQSLDFPMDCIQGNADRAVLDAMHGREAVSVPAQARPLVQWVADQLDESDRKIIEAWPPTHRTNVDGVGKVLFCHATPQSDTPIFTRETAESKLIPIFGGLDVDLVVCGHTHMQFDRRVGKVRVMNAGSVGMPFGRPGAYWLMLDSAAQLRHTEYDLTSAAERITHCSYPQADAFASGNVLSPPTEESILSAYANAELK